MKRKSMLLFLCSIFFSGVLFSCRTAGTDHSISPPLHKRVLAGEPSGSDAPLYPSPVVIPGSINFTASRYRHLWNTVPRKGKLVVFASTPRRESRKEEILYCLKDAARQISLFYGAEVKTKQAVESTGRDFGYLESVQSEFDKGLAEKKLSEIKVLEHFRDAEGTYIIAEDPNVPVSLDFSWTVKTGGSPGWITDVPSIKGYLVSVGVVQRSRYLTDSLRRADDQALANLSRQISINVKSMRTDLEVPGGTLYSQTHYEVSSSFLKGFYVLGRWSEDHGNTFYTLAVCRKEMEK